MKTLKHLREEYDYSMFIPETISLEEAKELKSISAAKMPLVLMFKRVTYRQFPHGQYVALYYSNTLDKYLSVPFGPEGNLNLSEAFIFDSLDEDWQDVNRKDKTDGLSQKAVNAYRRENPGSKLKTAVTEKNPTGKRASRRKSFCSRMGGMKKRLTSAKTARDPDSRINKALRRWNCEEDFKMRLNEMRMQRNEDALDAATFLPGFAGNVASGMSAIRNIKKGKYADAALDAVGAIDPTKAATGVGLSGLVKGGRMAYKATKALSAARKTKTATKAGEVARDASAIASKAKPSIMSRIKSGVGKLASAAAGAAAGAATGSSQPDTSAALSKPIQATKSTKYSSSWEKSPSSRPIEQARQREMMRKDAQTSKTVAENKIIDIRNMINEGIESLELPINGRQVTLNTSMAKRIIEVYDSVNTKNKKIVEGMLNEDLESFKKLLNFSIRN